MEPIKQLGKSCKSMHQNHQKVCKLY